jgi:hypothetical protein
VEVQIRIITHEMASVSFKWESTVYIMLTSMITCDVIRTPILLIKMILLINSLQVCNIQ